MKKLLCAALSFLLMFSLLNSCSSSEPSAGETEKNASLFIGEQLRSPDYVNPKIFEGLSLMRWDNEAVSEITGIEPPKKRTILLYLNGSDLETEHGMATGDINEILAAEYSPNDTNVVIFAGGTLEWKNDIIPNESCSILEITSGEMSLLHTFEENISIGNAGTLASFIDFSVEAFPADEYSLIMWNHGGGSIYGYGVDELNEDDYSLTLLEFNYALENSKFAEEKASFIGFDACLMATVETAIVAQKYAQYLVASQELEPGYGWDYSWLEITDVEDASTEDICKYITDSYFSFYEQQNDDYSTTLSVIDLSKIWNVSNKMGELLAEPAQNLQPKTFKALSNARSKTTLFGGGSPRDDGCDMIDVADMASQLSAHYPQKAEALFDAVAEAVVYNKVSVGNELAYGISTYYPFGGTSRIASSLKTYSGMMMDTSYTKYLLEFSKMLTGDSFSNVTVNTISPSQNTDGGFEIVLSQEQIDNLLEIYFTLWEPVEDEGMEDFYFNIGRTSDVDVAQDGKILTTFDGVWPGFNGEFASFYELSKTEKATRYAIPATLNGADVDIIILIDEKYPEGKVLGARPYADNETNMASKNLITIKDKDKITLSYLAEYFGEGDKESEWYESDEFTVKGELFLEWYECNEGETYMYGFEYTDFQNNTSYTELAEVSF